MTEPENGPEDTLLDYDEGDDEPEQQTNGTDAGSEKKAVKGTYVSIHSSGFRDFLLKPELLRAIVDCGFEHPSEGKVQMAPKIFLPVSYIFPPKIFILQFKMSVFHKLYLAWMLFAKQRVVWGKQQFLL